MLACQGSLLQFYQLAVSGNRELNAVPETAPSFTMVVRAYNWRLSAGASVEKIGEAAACAVKRLHLDHRMVQVTSQMPPAARMPTAWTCCNLHKNNCLIA